MFLSDCVNGHFLTPKGLWYFVFIKYFYNEILTATQEQKKIPKKWNILTEKLCGRSMSLEAVKEK